VQLSLAAAACLMLEYRARARTQRAEAERLRLDEAALARQLDAARAALLQAQVEPHFLFNTLAHLRRLASTRPREARALLADLLRYLEAALPSLRQPRTTLSRELELVHAFLALHQRRLGAERLRLVFDIEPGWEQVVLPSTCLLTLAENAIKHGIAPQVQGGEIALRVRHDGGLLRLEVADTGVGMGAGAGSGTGLATVRAQLAAHHPDARLSLLLNQPQGLIARIELPA
jgi:LytS/YehU family sensor histidine kinase